MGGVEFTEGPVILAKIFRLQHHLLPTRVAGKQRPLLSPKGTRTQEVNDVTRERFFFYLFFFFQWHAQRMKQTNLHSFLFTHRIPYTRSARTAKRVSFLMRRALHEYSVGKENNSEINCDF